MNFLQRLFIYGALITIFALLSACENQIQPVQHRGPEMNLVRDKPIKTVQAVKPATVNTFGRDILSSYSGSYALLIGESRYTNGWPSLEAIPGELREVEKVLISQGFQVETAFNLNYDTFKERFDTFINQYGFDRNNRLLFFYSGHGYTRNDKGYLVPVNAPNPSVNEKKFLQQAVDMDQVLTWARRIEAKHVLFLFDSCFSGTIFQARNLPTVPPQINKSVQEPVRQFITAGSANEFVPAKSVFTPAFIDALRYGWGDLYQDGYITGQELGLYLRNKVPQYTSQTPQYGKIKDYELSRGDFVFVVKKNAKINNPKIVTIQSIQPNKPTFNNINPPKLTPNLPELKIIIPDSDKDGLKDDHDQCRYNTALEISKGVDSLGCSLDSDQDKFADYQDACPNDSQEAISKGVNYKGCPKDFDRDGVADYQDACPRTFFGFKVKADGCPLPIINIK
ncbi:MAG: caspase family protein [Thiomargarita sp.]|nr:caspase family protein [Thiomargarita sp.]